MTEIKNPKLKRMVTKARSDFFTFCQVVCRDEPEFVEFAHFQELICNRIQHELVHTVTGIREMFSVPPGYGKSTLLSQLLVAYLLGVNPRYKIILISYGSELSGRNAELAKYFMEKPIYRLIFPETEIIGEKEHPPFDTGHGGGIRATGRGGQINGFRADFILIDDILKGPKEAASDAIIKEIREWYPGIINSRLKPSGGILILSTRWTKRDLIGWLSEQSSRWNYINLEALCTDQEKDPIGREVGEALWPEYKTLESLLEAKELNPRIFEVVYQGNCTAVENTSINVDKIRYVEKISYENPYIICCYDTASKTDLSHDHTAVTIWEVARDLSSAILLDIQRVKVEFPELLKLYDDNDFLYKPDLQIVEDANSGVQLIQMRKDKNILASKAFSTESKLSYADMLDVMFTDGQIKVKTHIKRLKEELQELDEFPFGSRDDVPLSCLHFIKWFTSEDAKASLVSRVNRNNVKNLLGKAKRRGRRNIKNRLAYSKAGSFR